MQKSSENQSVNPNFSGMDYYSRKVIRHNRLNSSLNTLVTAAKQKLSDWCIQHPENTQLIDYLKQISNLKSLDIPLEDGLVAHFCVLDKAKQGAIENILLIQCDSLKKELKNLIAAKKPEQFELQAQAVLKLPKQGSILEIHHAALALSLAGLLGLHTSSFTLVSYLGRPALFMPTEGVKSLNELDLDIDGEGLQADEYIEDFGQALAFSYLCNEADTNSGQIVGLFNAKRLNIYNPILNPTPKLVQFSDIEDGLCLDASLSVHPANNDPEIDRHFFAIDDSSINSKFQSLWNAFKLSKTITTAFDSLAAEIQIREVQLNELPDNSFNNTIINELKDLTLLKDDLSAITASIKSRLTTIERLFIANNFGSALNANNIKQVLILEKLVHLPVLFSHDGHPYRNPWINKPTNNIKSIVNTGESIVITFEHNFPPLVCERLKDHGLKSLEWAENTLKISRRDLSALTEIFLYPEASTTVSGKDIYSDKEDIALLFQTYAEKTHTNIINLFDNYANHMANTKTSAAEKLQIATNTHNELSNLLQNLSNKGLAKHILRKFHFSMQVQMQKMLPQPLLASVNQAFTAAVKLDRLIEFNKVLWAAISTNHVQDAPFKEFLQFCIKKEQDCGSYVQAQIQSKALFEFAERETVPFLQSANEPRLVMDKTDLKIKTIL